MNLEEVAELEATTPAAISTYPELVRRVLYLEERLQDHLDDHFSGEM